MKENPTISLRAAEATAISRSTAFNNPVVHTFYNDLMVLYEKYPTLNTNRIYNIDETALTTVKRSSKIFAKKGQSWTNYLLSTRRWKLYTVSFDISQNQT